MIFLTNTKTVPLPPGSEFRLGQLLIRVVTEASLLAYERDLPGWEGGAVVFLKARRSDGQALVGPVVVGNTTNFSTEDGTTLTAMCESVAEVLSKSLDQDHVCKTIYPNSRPRVAEGARARDVSYVFAGFPSGVNLAAALAMSVLDNQNDAAVWSTRRFAESIPNQLFRELIGRVENSE